MTSDIATEFYQLTRNRDISGIRIFIDSNFSKWDTEAFPFNKILTGMSLEGVDVSFILPNVPNVKSFKNDFKALINNLPKGLQPLMVVIMTDGTVKTYFGRNINTSYSNKWGGGDVFLTLQPTSITYSEVNRLQLLNDFSDGDGSFMFEFRVSEHSSLGRFFNSLKAPETDNWDKKNR